MATPHIPEHLSIHDLSVPIASYAVNACMLPEGKYKAHWLPIVSRYNVALVQDLEVVPPNVITAPHLALLRDLQLRVQQLRLSAIQQDDVVRHHIQQKLNTFLPAGDITGHHSPVPSSGHVTHVPQIYPALSSFNVDVPLYPPQPPPPILRRDVTPPPTTHATSSSGDLIPHDRILHIHEGRGSFDPVLSTIATTNIDATTPAFPYANTISNAMTTLEAPPPHPLVPLFFQCYLTDHQLLKLQALFTSCTITTVPDLDGYVITPHAHSPLLETCMKNKRMYFEKFLLSFNTSQHATVFMYMSSHAITAGTIIDHFREGYEYKASNVLCLHDGLVQLEMPIDDAKNACMQGVIYFKQGEYIPIMPCCEHLYIEITRSEKICSVFTYIHEQLLPSVAPDVMIYVGRSTKRPELCQLIIKRLHALEQLKALAPFEFQGETIRFLAQYSEPANITRSASEVPTMTTTASMHQPRLNASAPVNQGGHEKDKVMHASKSMEDRLNEWEVVDTDEVRIATPAVQQPVRAVQWQWLSSTGLITYKSKDSDTIEARYQKYIKNNRQSKYKAFACSLSDGAKVTIDFEVRTQTNTKAPHDRHDLQRYPPWVEQDPLPFGTTY